MQYRPLGTTGISISTIAFGAGPVSGLMTNDSREVQREVISQAVELGINWFDTAATYGAGRSETNLGRALTSIRCDHPLYIGTKVRVTPDWTGDWRPRVLESLHASLARLQKPKVTLLQIHNAITRNRNDQPTSITPEDVLGPQGLLAGLEDARDQGLVDHFGLTGLGDAPSLETVMQSRRFATIQAPFHLLNPSGLREIPTTLGDPDYGRSLKVAHALGLGLFAIRVFAAGALLNAEPSAHTLKTPFFPLDLYQRDLARARSLQSLLGSDSSLREVALRYVLAQPEFASAIIGFGEPAHVAESVRMANQPPLTDSELHRLHTLLTETV